MTYRLIASDDNDSPRAIGRHPDYESAPLTRIKDVISDGAARQRRVVDSSRSRHRWPRRRRTGHRTSAVHRARFEPTVTGFPSTMTSRRRIRWLLRAHELQIPEVTDLTPTRTQLIPTDAESNVRSTNGDFRSTVPQWQNNTV